MASDFPFGQPSQFITRLSWPTIWIEYVRYISALGKAGFENAVVS